MSSLVALEEGDQALHVSYSASATAAAFINDPAFITGYFGPFGCGKTSAGAQKAYVYGQAFPGAKIGVFRDTYPNLRDTTMATFFEWFPAGACGHYHKTDKIFELYTPGGGASCLIYFRAMDSEDDINNALSLELAAAWFDEPQGGINTKGGLDPGISVNLYRAMAGRVGRQRGFPLALLWLTGNPPAPSHWIAQEFGYEGVGIPANLDPDKHLYLGTQEDNVANLNEGRRYYERLERMWGKNTPLARRFIRGEWVSMGVEKPFKRSQFQHWGPGQDFAEAPKGLVVEIGFDPAISKRDTAARSAIVVGGQARLGEARGRIFCLEAEAGHWSVYEQVAKLLNAYRRWHARAIRIEKVAYQESIAQVLDHEARLAGLNVHVELVEPDADKLMRANAWAPLVEDGTILFGPGQDDLEDSMNAIPGDPSKWDLVDAAGYCFRGFPLMQPESTRLPGQELSTPKTATSYAARSRTSQPQERFARILRQDGMERARGYAVQQPKGVRPRPRAKPTGRYG